MEPRVIPVSTRSNSARARVWSLQPDAVLCHAACAGNELAFSELYRRHYPSLRAFVFHLLGARHRHEDSEDVVQDAFARAFDAICEQRFRGDFKRWIFTIARNRSVDLLRGERVRLVSLESAGVELHPPAAAEATTPVAIAEAHDEVAWLVNAIDQLPERQRSALLLRELGGLSHVEIAETLDSSVGSVRQLITRARDGVRDAAERDGREHDTSKRKDLRRELLDAVPMLPLAAAGVAVSTGATAGGSIALGKIAATIIAALVIAGSASEVGKVIAEASESKPEAAAPTTTVAPSAPTRSHVNAGEGRGASDRPDVKFADGTPSSTGIDAKPKKAASAEPSKNGETHASVRDKPLSAQGPAAAPTPVQPVKEVLELPGRVLEHVSDTVSSVVETVDDVVGAVTDTVDGVTTGLLGAGSK